MPGLEMPVRGGGAAMLRELRDEERPLLEDQPVLEEQPTPPEINSEKQTDNKTDQSYDNMTNNLTIKQTEQKTSNKPSKSSRKQTTIPVSQSEIKHEIQPGSQNVGQSVADIIRRRSAQRKEQEVLKTVTLKLSPSLDEKVEQYCFDNKMKKQEFWAEAAALYFEMIAEEGS